jgi:lipoprotein-anchoring transpeptidase ErfK/SrfK
MVIGFGASFLVTVGSVLMASGSPALDPGEFKVQPTCEPDCCEPSCAEINSPANKAELASETAMELVVDLSDRQLYLYQGSQLHRTYDVAIGKEDWQTPIGVFHIMHKRKNPTWQHPISGKIVPPGPENPLGAAWIGFWVDGGYQIGFHGTLETASIGKAISHGCLRMHNQDILELFDQVEEGWTVIVRS